MDKTGIKFRNLVNVEPIKWNWVWSERTGNEYECNRCPLSTKKSMIILFNQF